jgi:hypothetical protein
MRKALQAEQGRTDLEKRIVVVEEEKKGLEAQVASLKAKCDEIEKKGAGDSPVCRLLGGFADCLEGLPIAWRVCRLLGGLSCRCWA